MTDDGLIGDDLRRFVDALRDVRRNVDAALVAFRLPAAKGSPSALGGRERETGPAAPGGASPRSPGTAGA